MNSAIAACLFSICSGLSGGRSAYRTSCHARRKSWYSGWRVLEHETKPVELVVDRDKLLLLLFGALFDSCQSISLVYRPLRLGIEACRQTEDLSESCRKAHPSRVGVGCVHRHLSRLICEHHPYLFLRERCDGERIVRGQDDLAIRGVSRNAGPVADQIEVGVLPNRIEMRVGLMESGTACAFHARHG